MKSVAFLVAVFLLSHVVSGYAEPAAPRSPELTGIQSRLKEANENIEQIKLKREKLLAQLQEIEKQYGITASSVRTLGLQIGGKQERLKTLSKEMQKLQAELKLQSNELGKQVKAAFVMGKKEQLKLLLNQQDPALASRMLVYYHYLNKGRLQKLTALKNNISLLANLEQEKQRETDSLEQATLSHKTAQASLGQTEKQRDKVLLELNQAIKEKSRQLGELAEDEKASQALIEKLQQAALEQEKHEILHPANSSQLAGTNQLDIDGNIINLGSQQDSTTASETSVSKPFVKQKGQLPWPIKGSIVKKFGSQRSETRWDGVLISAAEGADIRAVSSGRVVFANWLRGYGLLIIIDHGHGYMSLYAFNQSLDKKAGEYVKAGTVIGTVGKSGGREEAGLYFGIRNKGKPVDPVSWCKK